MSKRAIASFTVTNWDPKPYGEGSGPHLSRTAVSKDFSGDLDGTSTGELLTCQADPADLSAGAGYVASEVVTGTLTNRTGTFVLQHMGISGGGYAPRSLGHVVPGSGTGGFVGITGSAEFKVDADGSHTLILEYTLG